MTLPNLPPNRKQWQKIRDDAGVGKGAVRKISMGDAVDTWHKAMATGSLATLKKQSKGLQFNANLYRKTLPDKYKTFGPTVEKEIELIAKEWASWADAVAKQFRGAAIDYENAWKVFTRSESVGPDHLVAPVQAVIRVLDANHLSRFHDPYGKPIRELKKYVQDLAAFRQGMNPDPLSGVNSLIPALAKKLGV